MLPEIVDAPRIWRGDDWSWPITFYSDKEMTQTVDLTGFGTTWKSQARTSPTAELTVEFAIDSTNAADGLLIFSLNSDDTMGIVPSQLIFDLEAMDTKVTLITGTVLVDGDVTRA